MLATWQRMAQPVQRMARTNAGRSVAEKRLPHHKNYSATESSNVPNAKSSNVIDADNHLLYASCYASIRAPMEWQMVESHQDRNQHNLKSYDQRLFFSAYFI